MRRSGRNRSRYPENSQRKTWKKYSFESIMDNIQSDIGFKDFLPHFRFRYWLQIVTMLIVCISLHPQGWNSIFLASADAAGDSSTIDGCLKNLKTLARFIRTIKPHEHYLYYANLSILWMVKHIPHLLGAILWRVVKKKVQISSVFLTF